MERLTVFAGIIAIGLLSGGCAGVDHYTIPQQPIIFDDSGKINDAAAKQVKQGNKEIDKKFNGVRYYGTSMYLLVYSDGKGNIVWKILELPDQTKKMSAHPYNFLARLETQMTFTNGALDRSAQFVDATVVPRAMIEAAAQVLSFLAFDAEKYTVPPPELYKIVPTTGGFEFVGWPGKDRIKVTIPEGGR